MLDYSRAVCRCKTHRCNRSSTGAEGFTGFTAVVLCINAGLQQSGLQCKAHR